MEDPAPCLCSRCSPTVPRAARSVSWADCRRLLHFHRGENSLNSSPPLPRRSRHCIIATAAPASRASTSAPPLTLFLCARSRDALTTLGCHLLAKQPQCVYLRVSAAQMHANTRLHYLRYRGGTGRLHPLESPDEKHLKKKKVVHSSHQGSTMFTEITHVHVFSTCRQAFWTPKCI